MIPYILHVSILIAGCYIFYWLLLRKETFFKLNRGVLIACLLIPMVLPLITIPASWALQVFPSHQLSNNKPTAIVKTISEDAPIPIQTTEIRGVGDSKVPPIASTSEIITPVESQTPISISQQLFYFYWIGVAVFAIAFLIQLILILAKIASLNSMQDGKYKIVELVKDEAPYSFWNTIFINPSKYDAETYEQILAHEKIHIDQTHYLDMLLVELAVIVFWFNPFVWLFRKAITNNLEFLTDESMLTQGFPKQSYQMSLLKVSVPQYPLNLTTNYNQSFLKNRIAMMNTKKSSARSVWKYLFILPLLGFSIISLNAVENSSNNINTIENIEETPEEISNVIPEEKITETTTNNEPSPETEENKALREEVMAQLKRDDLLDGEDPVFKLFPNKILLNDKPLKSKLRKKYKAIFQKHGISSSKSRLLIVKPLVIMSGSFVGNQNAEDGTHVDVFDEEDNQAPDNDDVTLHTTTTTSSNSTGKQISVTTIGGKTYVRGGGEHIINGKSYNIKPDELTVIDEHGNSSIIEDNESVEKALLEAHEKTRNKDDKTDIKNDQKVNQHTIVTTTTTSDESTSDEVVVTTVDGKTYIKGDNETIYIDEDGEVKLLNQKDEVDQESKRKRKRKIYKNSKNPFLSRLNYYFSESNGEGNFNFLHPSDILTASTNEYWKLPTFCKEVNDALTEDGIINSGDKVIFYYLGSDGIFVNGQHLTGKFVRQFETIANENNIPLVKELRFEMDRNQVIILDQISSINRFRDDILNQLSEDNFISNKKKKMVMEISGNNMSVNGKEISTDKYATYFKLFNKYRITPAPGKTIETNKESGKETITVGYTKDNATLGTFASYK